MRKRMKIGIMSLLAGLVLTCSMTVSAENIPYRGYEYNAYEMEMGAPISYRVERVTNEYGTNERFSKPVDLFRQGNELYVLDADEKCVVVLDLNLDFIRTLNQFTDGEKQLQFQSPSGLFVDAQQNLYIADNGAKCIYKFDNTGKLLQLFEKPSDPSFDQTVSFDVTKVLVDQTGNVYALINGLYSGAVVFRPDGSFSCFFGANRVEMDLEKLWDQFWRSLLSEEQITAMSRFIPVSYSNFDIDEKDFVYTCSKDIEEPSQKIRKLNPTGNGLWENDGSQEYFFGDYAESTLGDDSLTSVFGDVEISEEGFLFALDITKGRIYEYDSNGNFIGAFGGKGQQKGCFQMPSALESAANRVYVADEATGSISLFCSTEYNQVYQQAVTLTAAGEYAQAEACWRKVLQFNGNNEAALTGLGLQAMKEQDIAQALELFRLANNPEQYSRAFEVQRVAFIRSNLIWILPVVVLAIILLRLLLKKDPLKVAALCQPVRKHFRVIIHPIDGYQDIMEKNTYAPSFAVCVVAYWVFLEVLRYFGTGFIFQTQVAEEFNLLLVLMGTVVALGLFVVANWLITTLTDGKGSMRRIFCTSGYVLLPYLICQTAVLLLSHVLVTEEQAFLTILQIIGLLWSFGVLLATFTQLHEFSTGKTIGSLLLTVAGIAVILFLLFMVVVLAERVWDIFSTIWNEISLRG